MSRAEELIDSKSPGPDGLQLQVQKGLKPPVLEQPTATAAGEQQVSKMMLGLYSPQTPALKAHTVDFGLLKGKVAPELAKPRLLIQQDCSERSTPVLNNELLKFYGNQKDSTNAPGLFAEQ